MRSAYAWDDREREDVGSPHTSSASVSVGGSPARKHARSWDSEVSLSSIQSITLPTPIQYLSIRPTRRIPSHQIVQIPPVPDCSSPAFSHSRRVTQAGGVTGSLCLLLFSFLGSKRQKKNFFFFDYHYCIPFFGQFSADSIFFFFFYCRTHRFGSVLLVPCRDRLRCVHREICIDECTGTVNGATLHRSCASASAPALPYPTNPAQTQAVPTAPLHFPSLIPLADIFAHESKRNHREFFLRVPWVTAILVVPIDKVVKGGAVDTGADLC
jgi:hypothetical protein